MTTQTEPRLAARVEAMFEAVLAGDFDRLVAQMHPDVEVVEPVSLPFGGVYRGLDAFLGLFAKMSAGFDVTLTDGRVIDGGEVVVGQMNAVFTAKRTGEVLSIPYVEVYGFEDGLIRKVTVYPSDTKIVADFMAANG